MTVKHKPPVPAKRIVRPLRARGSARVIKPATSAAMRSAPIFERPDGFYWLAPDGTQEFGPFETAELARADRDPDDDEQDSSLPSEALEEAERDLGIAEWIDPETGEPAEGLSVPRLSPD
jgi:hypothetical protein